MYVVGAFGYATASIDEVHLATGMWKTTIASYIVVAGL